MPGRVSHYEQAAAITRVSQVAPQAQALRDHLAQVLASSAFKSSRRCQDFLRHIVEKALEGHFDELKERALGVELFGRPASYDTGEDAIVRVTASDVRRRLLQFYAGSGLGSVTRIDLPAGSYVPEFHAEVVAPGEAIPELVAIPAHPQPKQHFLAYQLIVGILTGLLIAAGFWTWNRQTARNALLASNVLPWSAILRPNQPLRIVLCDPDIVTVQRLLDFNISLSDYANRRYAPATKPQAEIDRVLGTFRGVNVAAADNAISMSISQLAGTESRQLNVRRARTLQLSDFKIEDNLVLLGSPRSNPWVRLFEDQLDFYFELDPASRQEVIRNRHPQAGEAAAYIPTAQGFGTGQAYGTIAFLANPNQKGYVLLLAGSNAEATEATGKLATNLDLLAQTLRNCGIEPAGPPRHFQALLRVATMAGSPNTFEVIACHRLTKD